jgi:tellurite resistance protein
MQWVKAMAQTVRENRRPAAADNPLVAAERQASERIEQSLDAFRDIRDGMYERAFKAIYGSPWLAAAVGLGGESVRRRGPKAPTWEYQELKRLKRLMAESQIEQGTLLDGWVRIALYVAREDRVFDERPYNLARRMIDQRSPEARPSLDELKAAVKRQAFVLALDEERAVAALPKLLPEGQPRREALEGARLVAGAGGLLTEDQERRFRRIERVLGLEASQLRSVG